MRGRARRAAAKVRAALISGLECRVSRVPAAVMRVTIGIAFVVSARGKLMTGHPGITEGLEFLLEEGWSQATYTIYRPFVEFVLLPNISVVAFLVMWGELLVGLALIVGLVTRFAAFWALFINLNIVLAAGATMLPPGTDSGFVLADLVLLTAAAGRSYGVDAVLLRRFGTSILW